MKIEKATGMGFCFGVRRAIELVEKTRAERGSLYTLGALVHNQQVVDRLHKRGIEIAANLDTIPSGIVAITSHGVSPEVVDQAQKKGLEIIDATCPFVRKAQVAAQKLSMDGFSVIVVGDANHPEVKGVLGWAGKDAGAFLNIPQYTVWPKRVGILCQTTQTHYTFGKFLSQIVAAGVGQISELRIINTICDATRRNQDAALELARRVQAMIVVGGRNSSNTTRLAEICEATGVTTYHIESAQEINPVWLQGLQHVGVTAGASTPDEVIEDVVRTLKNAAGGEG